MPARIDLDTEEIVNLYQNGMSACSIARGFNVSTGTITKRLKEADIDIRGRLISMDSGEIARLYKSGLSADRIGEKLGVSSNTIFRRLNEHGVDRRTPNEINIQHIGIDIANDTYRNKGWLVNQYCRNNMSQEEMAKMCGVNRASILKWMRRHGVDARSVSDQSLLRANSVLLCDENTDFIDGLLLGDGCLIRKSNISAKYSHADKHSAYIIWLLDKIESFGISQSGKIRMRETQAMGYRSVAYDFNTKSYIELLDIYKRWYIDGKKRVPQDLCLSKTSCMNWYIGDGCLKISKQRSGRPSIVLYTNGFLKNDVLLLIEKLMEIGICAVRQPSRNTLRLNHENTLKFLDYIGPCPEPIWHCYGYKWDLTRTKKEWEAEFARP